MRKQNFLPVLLLIFLQHALPAQTPYMDSLRTLIQTGKDDTAKVIHYRVFGDVFGVSKPDTAILLYQQSLALAEKLKWEKGIALGHSHIASVSFSSGKYLIALENYAAALETWQRLYPPDGGIAAANALGNMGLVFGVQGDYARALEYDFKALKIAQDHGDKNGISRHLGNIGIIYEEQGELAKALDQYLQALKISEELGDKRLTDYWLVSLGTVYRKKGEYATSLKFLTRALELAIELKDPLVTGSSYYELGHTYLEQGNFEQAKQSYLSSIATADKINDRQIKATALGGMGKLYLKAPGLESPEGETKKGFELAEKYLLEALELATGLGILNEKMTFENELSALYTKTGKHEEALAHYKSAMIIKDSLFNIEKSKAIIRNEMNYEFERKDALAKAEQEKKDLKKAILIYSVVGALVLILAFSFFLYRRFKVTQAQNREIIQQRDEIRQQKHLIEDHRKEIVDSITYAKRLQDAILPPLDSIKEKLPASFVLYKPKDIVAGDFYWMETIGDTIYIAAADCTGHGVPGAMVSIVCSNALNRAVKEFRLTETGKILDKVTDLVLETFEKSAADVKDGMDISMLSINQQTKQVCWSGANNPLWYFSKQELMRVVADKQPVGKSDHRKSFTTHTIAYEPGMMFYLFTDGFADQFGGPKGKKFMYKNFEEALVMVSEQEMTVQQQKLEEVFNTWKGDLEQVDDVCIIGVRL